MTSPVVEMEEMDTAHTLEELGAGVGAFIERNDRFFGSMSTVGQVTGLNYVEAGQVKNDGYSVTILWKNDSGKRMTNISCVVKKSDASYVRIIPTEEEAWELAADYSKRDWILES